MTENLWLRAAIATSGESYPYRECGLDNIFLRNGFETLQHDGEEHFAVADVDGLHAVIGRYLATQSKALSPTEVRFLRKQMDLTQADLAARLGCDTQTVARWEKGTTALPGPEEKLLRATFLAHDNPRDRELEALNKLRESMLDSIRSLVDEAVPPAQFQFAEHWDQAA